VRGIGLKQAHRLELATRSRDPLLKSGTLHAFMRA
jgi:hypothetical protein